MTNRELQYTTQLCSFIPYSLGVGHSVISLWPDLVSDLDPHVQDSENPSEKLLSATETSQMKASIALSHEVLTQL